jgi:hypothetical protein
MKRFGSVDRIYIVAGVVIVLLWIILLTLLF